MNKGRRDFLKSSLLFSTSLLIGSSAIKAARLAADRSDNKILIIGAGMAGLSAGNTLHENGYKVTILEGRNRIGGRIWTDRSWGSVNDLGASWIHGTTGNPITQLSNKLGLATKITDYDSYQAYQADGTLIPDRQVDSIQSNYDRLFGILKRQRREAIRNGLPDISLAEAINKYIGRLELSDIDRQQLEYRITTEIEHDYAGALNDLSFYYFDQDTGLDGDDVLFPKGYDQITNHLAQGLDIRLDQAVSRIEYNEQGVKVTTNRDQFVADYLILTVPLGILKEGSIEFRPALPASKLNAIKNLNMGVLNKVFLKFPQSFWPKNIDLFGYIAQRRGEWCEMFNYYKYTRDPVLLLFNATDYGTQIEALSDAQIVNSAMKTLKRMFGESTLAPERSLITRWNSDPFSRGSYSHIRKGGSGKDYDVMAQPLGRLLFAGEATYREEPATVHGAYLSGQREANRIMNKAATTRSNQRTDAPSNRTDKPSIRVIQED